MIRRLAALVAIACVGIGLPAVAASATPLPDLTCGPITTSVKLRHDLNCPDGIQIIQPDSGGPAAPPDLTIDLGGHTLSFTSGNCGGIGPTPCEVFVQEPGTVVDIINGAVAGNIVYTNPNRFGLPGSAGGLLSRLHVEGAIDLGGRNGRIRDSTVDQGVFIDGLADARISHNTIHGSVEVEGSATIDHNVIFGSVRGDDDCPSFCFPQLRITHNLITQSPNDGISFELNFLAEQGDFVATVSGNVITNSAGAAISLTPAPFTALGSFTITNNLLVANHGDGFQLVGTVGLAATVPSEVVKGNVAIGNGGHGFNIEGAPTAFTLTAKNNTASANSTDPQCVGIVCLP